MGMEEYKLEAHPVSKKEAIIQGDCYRITMLTSALVRLEYNSEGVFEDRATQSVLNRDFPVPEFKVVEDEEELVIYTDSLEIHYNSSWQHISAKFILPFWMVKVKVKAYKDSKKTEK